MADQLRDLLTRIVSRERHRGTVLLDADELCAIETALAQAEPVQPAAGVDAYDMIDRFLRNNLRDDDYAEYSAALDSLYTAPQQAEPVQEPVAFDTAHAMRLADEYADLSADHADLSADHQFAQAFPDRAFVHKRKLINEARGALEAYLSRQAEPERNFCPRCGKRLSSDGIHTCTPPQTKCSHCASPLFAALECRVCGRKEAK